MNRPICLFAKIEAPSFSSLGMVEGLKENGYSVLDLDWQAYRFGNGVENFRKYLIGLAQEYMPELIFLHIQNADVMDRATAKELSKCGTVVNFSEDVRDPLPSWYVEVGQEIALTLFTNREDVDVLNKQGIRAEYIQTSYNQVWYKPQPKTSTQYGDIIFIGNNFVDTNLKFPQAIERYGLISYLKGKYGHQFKAYGQNWGADVRRLNPQESVAALNNAKVVITHSNFIRRGYTSDRLFNTTGCGAYVVARNYEGINFDFPLGIPTWNEFEDIDDHVRRGLYDWGNPHSVKETLYKTTKERHTWVQRFAQIKEMING